VATDSEQNETEEEGGLSGVDRPVAIITGASSGIGKATAIRMAECGYDVGITFNDNEVGATDTAQEIEKRGGVAAIRHLDLTSPESGSAVMDDLIHELGGLHVLVNNAGVNRRCELFDESLEEITKTFAVNLFGAWACSAAVVRYMKEEGGGKIVNISSVLAHAPLVGAGAYCAAKSAMESMSKVMAIEWAPFNILVNTVAPGHTATPINYSTLEESLAAQERRPVIPLRRAASSEEIAFAIAFLADERSSYTTGATLLVDGGLLLVSGPTQLEEATGRPPQ
jgi:NAD(P)-dependent dehydrogenase (short-subunit alcohol dehydrogenase family)